MTRHIAAQRALAAAVATAAIAIPASLVHAHGVTEPTVNGPSSIGTTIVGNGTFDLPGITLDCPPPEGGPKCRVTITVKSRSPLRLKPGGSRKIRTIGRFAYDLDSNRDMAEIWPAVLTADGAKVLERYGKVKAVARVRNAQSDHAAQRLIKLTVKQQ